MLHKCYSGRWHHFYVPCWSTIYLTLRLRQSPIFVHTKSTALGFPFKRSRDLLPKISPYFPTAPQGEYPTKHMSDQTHRSLSPQWFFSMFHDWDRLLRTVQDQAQVYHKRGTLCTPSSGARTRGAGLRANNGTSWTGVWKLLALRMHLCASRAIAYWGLLSLTVVSGPPLPIRGSMGSCWESPHREREREREIFISPWLQVCVTGPRHHLASSLLTKCRGHDEKGREYLHGLQVWSFKVRSPVLYG